MRCALVFPGVKEHSTLLRQPLIHYGMCILSAVLRNKGIEVDYIDCIAENLNIDGFKRRIERFNPDIVGFTATTIQINSAGYLAEIVKNINNKIYTVIGGVHTTILPERTLKEFPAFDVAVCGEGIVTLPELLQQLPYRNLLSIKGIAFRNDKDVIVTPSREFSQDLDQWPYPAFDLLNLPRYSSYSFYNKSVIELPVFLSIGCPFSCKYCFRLSGKTVRSRSPERAIEDIEIGIKKFGCRHFMFFDDTFGIDKNRYTSLMELMITSGINKQISWSCMSRVDIIDRDLLKLIKEAGCSLIYYGVESGSDKILESLGKDINTEKIINVFRMTRETGIKAGASFMIGVPGETRETLKETEDFIFSLKPDLLDLSVFQPYPGSWFYNEVISGKYNVRIKELRWEHFYRMTGRNLIYENFEEGEIDKTKWKILAKFYSSPSRLILGRKYITNVYGFLAGYLLNLFYWKIYRKIKSKLTFIFDWI